MISFLSGKIIAKEKNVVVVVTSSGIGYEVRVSPILFLQLVIGNEVKLFTYMHVREDAQELFGVMSFPELSFLKTLIAVSGVGPRSALNILSLGPIEETRQAIAEGDINYLTKVSGIGKKIAERIIVELKGKLDLLEKEDGKNVSRAWSDVADALVGMGYSVSEARAALREAGGEEKNASELLRKSLKILNRK